MKALQQAWGNKSLRNKILITLGLLVVYKMFTHIPVPGADLDVLAFIFEQSGALGALSTLTGGSVETFSIVLMGLSPYINASIIMQLLGVIVPKLEAIRKDGKRGQEKITKYTRWLTLPLAFLQSFGMIILLNTLNPSAGPVVSPLIELGTNPSMLEQIIAYSPTMLTVTAGTMFLMWLGEMITEKGIGNGISLIIFASIITSVPSFIGQQLSLIEADPTAIYTFLLVIAVTIALLAFVVWFTEAQRNIPVTYSQHGAKGMEKSSLPIRLNQAGMIPIIFGISMVTFPSIIANIILSTSSNTSLIAFADFVNTNFNPSNPNGWYVLIYFLLVLFFAYFYVSITFQPDQVAENIQKRGGFIPGVRPGKETTNYLAEVSSRLTFWGGTAIAFVAVFPYLLNFFTTSSGLGGNVELLITGAGIIIIVGVVLELQRQVKTEMVMKDYDKFY